MFHSWWALLAWAGAGFVLAYVFVSRAIDTGSLWQYFGGLVFFVISIKLLVRMIKK